MRGKITKKQLAFAPPSLILANNFLPLNEALCFPSRVGVFIKTLFIIFFGLILAILLQTIHNAFKLPILFVDVLLTSLWILAVFDFYRKYRTYRNIKLSRKKDNFPGFKFYCATFFLGSISTLGGVTLIWAGFQGDFSNIEHLGCWAHIYSWLPCAVFVLLLGLAIIFSSIFTLFKNITSDYGVNS